MRARRIALVALVAAVVGCLAPAAARADGDPPSDFLLSQDTFVPLQHPPTAAQTQALVDAVAKARTGTIDLKVAVVGSQVDLGTVGQLWGHPDQYAPFLRKEIRFTFTGTLLVVMPAGMATAGPHASAVLHAAESAGKPTAGDSSGQLTETATKAATAVGAKFPHARSKRSGGRSATFAIVLAAAGIAGLLLATALGIAIARVSRRRRDAAPPADD